MKLKLKIVFLGTLLYAIFLLVVILAIYSVLTVNL